MSVAIKITCKSEQDDLSRDLNNARYSTAARDPSDDDRAILVKSKCWDFYQKDLDKFGTTRTT